MKYSKIYLVFLMVSLVFVSCDNGFEELNQNPNDPIAVPSKLILPNTIRISQNIMNSTFVGGDMGACWSQQFAKVQYNDEALYIPRNSVIQSTVWSGFYASVLADAKKMQDLALVEENNDMQGAALVMQAYAYSVLTDAFGMIPFSEALQGEEGTFTPIFDSQEDVYTGIVAMLDEANTLLDGTGGIDGTSDILYGGDYTGWKKMANSLKFRALMRISAKKDVSADLQDIVNNRMVFTGNADEAKLVYLSSDPNANPLYETIVFGTRGEWKVNSVLVDMLNSYNDPRLPVMAQLNADGVYRGKPSGIRDVPSVEYSYANVSPIGLLYLEAEAPGYFMSYAELQFLMAEAAQKGYISGSAATFYDEGVRASFERNGIEADYATYIAQPSVAYNAGDGLRRIGEQKWLSLFGQGVEAWTEWRRTGFPVLTPAIEADLNEIPSRYTYPSNTQSLNGTNYGAAISAQGADLLTTKVWWMN
jgi:hypothetical protein